MLRLPERIHKRPFVVSISVVLALLAATGILVFALGIFGPGSDLMRVYVTADEIATSVNGGGTSVDGIGINLKYLPAANLLKNPSFENTQYDRVYTVSGGTENAVYVLSDSGPDAVYEDSFFVGGTVRIMSLDQDGQMVPKMQATVTDFRINQLGLWTPLTVPSGAAEGQKVTSLTSSSNITVAVGDKGLLITDVTSADPSILDLGITENFAASSCILDRFYAVTGTGTFVTSSDGKTWNSFNPDPADSYSVHTVSSLGKIGVAAGDAGVILLCSGGQVISVPSNTTQNLLTSSGDGTSIIIAGMGGTVLITSNGVIFRTMSEQEMPSFAAAPNWQCSDYRNGSFVLGGDQGQIALGSFSTQTGLFSFTSHQATDESGKSLSVRHVLMLSSGEIIIMDDSGFLYCSNDGGETWKLLPVNSMKTIDEIGQTFSGKILLSQGVTSQTTQLFTRIQFDEIQSENIFQAGDMCFLERSVPSQKDQTVTVDSESLPDSSTDANKQADTSAQAADNDLWQGMGAGTTISMKALAPSGGGSSSLQILGSDVKAVSQPHFVSQVITGSGDTPFKKDTLYQIKVWFKQDGISNGEVMAWISGHLISAGTTFTDVGNAWRQYTYTFFLPAEATAANTGEIRFNIGFTGQGILDIDKVYFGLEKNADSSIPDSFATPVIKSAPNLIRLDNIGLGRMGVSPQAWVLSSGNEGLLKNDSGFEAAGCNSLESSLAFVRDTGADPWLVLNSAGSKTTIDNLMAYLCGSISDPYGKLRIENGTAVPWSIQFSRFVIEISDIDKIFSTDIQRGAFVDYMINLIQSSPYYNDYKDKFVFIDGMVYEGGTMLSQADYHASSLTVSNQSLTASGISSLTFSEAVSEGYASYFDSIPRTPARPQQGADEWIRSSALSLLQTNTQDGKKGTTTQTVTAADCVRMLLSDMGEHSNTILFDLPVSKNGADADTAFLFADQGNTKADKLLFAGNNRTMLAVSTLLSDSVKGTAVQIDIKPPILSGTQDATTDTAASLVQDGLIKYGFKYDKQIHTVVANTTDKPVLFLMDADWSLKGAYVYRYSSDGVFLEKTKLGQRNNRVNLLPGEVIVAKIPVEN